MTAPQAEQALDRILGDMGSVVVAFSGGVDSAYLAVRAQRVLAGRALAVTADSESLADEQRAMAREVAGRFGLAHEIIHTSEVSDPLYARNDADRCYHCKSELFRRLVPLARERGFAHVAYGLVSDDLREPRPGHRAAVEAGVRSPLAEAGMAKQDVRACSRAMGLPTADLPASPCLASRIPYGTLVTPRILRQVERAESALRGLGLRELRVRHLGTAARVEIAPEEMGRLGELRTELVAAVRAAGYEVVTIEAYRRGRLNHDLASEVSCGVRFTRGSVR